MDSDAPRVSPDLESSLDAALGYLNFSSGSADRAVLTSLNDLFRAIEEPGGVRDDTADVVHRLLRERLDRLHARGGPFANDGQARAVLLLWHEVVAPGYRAFHRDLLAHHRPGSLSRPFFIGRMWEAILEQGTPWDELDRIRDGAIAALNDYVGYRPVAVLEDRACEPYGHEWVRPIPLFIADVGVASGAYEELIGSALAILRQTDPAILHEAWFDLANLDELALDAKSYDFDHPVNRRPAYHFGQWDPNCIDNRGFYRRFVLQQVALDALLTRVDEAEAGARSDRLFEVGAVLAGTILMASGLCGNGPGCHDSSVSLSTLLPHIAGYRDRFYEELIDQVPGKHGQRLRAEAEKLRQPFGGARQHLNQQLARRRAVQLQQAHLAVLCARMGYPVAAARQADAVQIPSARIISQIHCHLTAAHDVIDGDRLSDVTGLIERVEELLHRGIECGALVDPWNVVGFGGNFPVFSAIEDSLHDYRVDKLIELVEQLLGLCARAWSEAAARDIAPLERQFSSAIGRLAAWWDAFATASVEGVHRLVGKEVEISANLVAGALNSWHKAGAAAGDVAFWRMFVDQFDSPKGFQLVLDALLEQGDCVASMALMMQWISQVDRTPLKAGDASFHSIAQRWLSFALKEGDGTVEAWWPLVRKFVELLEANADEYGRTPTLRLGGTSNAPFKAQSTEAVLEDDSADEDESDSLFSAAYENVVFRDSTDDGIDDALLEAGADDSDFELEQEARRLKERLKFQTTVARLWRRVVVASGCPTDEPDDERHAFFDSWRRQAATNYEQLTELLRAVHALPIRAASQTTQALMDYDRRRLVKDTLLEEIVETCVKMADAARLLTAACGARDEAQADTADTARWKAFGVLRGLLAGDRVATREAWPRLTRWLAQHGLLYVPLARGGDPLAVVDTKSRQQLIRRLLQWLPRLGMIRETCHLLTVAHAMETDNPISHGAVTEFDQLFKDGYLAMVRCLVDSSSTWAANAQTAHTSLVPRDGMLIDSLQRLTELLLHVWLEHSRMLRLSVVEKVADHESWEQFVAFVERFGKDLFRQAFLGMGNVRAILHQGVERWLAAMRDDPPDDQIPRLVEALDNEIELREAAKWLTFALETVAENYTEYRDYNATTTQSDQGDLLFAFVDFLRLRNDYDRIAWNLKPVVLAHEVLVRRGRSAAAAEWRRALVGRTEEAADDFGERHAELCAEYGMWLPTIAGRLDERFTRPLDVGRIRALVGSAVEEAFRGDSNVTFAVLEHEVEKLAAEPCGAGLDVPDWLEALEDEVDRARSELDQGNCDRELLPDVPQVCISWEELRAQLDDAEAMFPK